MATDRYKYFRIEAAELLDHLTRGVLAFEKQPSRTDALGALLRHAHTLKGAARVVRQLEIADAAHALEDELSRLQAAPNVEGAQSLLSWLDVISARLAQLDAPQATASQPKVRAAQVVRADASQLESVRGGITESMAGLSQLRNQTTSLSTLRELAEVIERQSLTRRLTHAHQYETLLGSIHSTVSDLIASLKLLERSFSTTLERVNRELQGARLVAEQVQLVSASTIFDSLERSVRDAGSELRKDVRFEASGGDLKLDSHVLDVTHRALLHLVRNAVAHGIEAKARRTAADKPAAGLVRVSVSRTEQRLRFSCEDDGQGIDVERLNQALRASSEDFSKLDSDQTVLQALLRGGITTSTHVNNIAGRGVGMAAVREAVESVGGTIKLHNRPARGATFELLVPATLSSIVGLWVEVGGETVVLPLEWVQKTQALDSSSLLNTGDQVLVRVGDDLVPYLPLHVALNLSAPATARLAILVQHGERRLALGISRVIGCQTQVMRRLPAELPSVPLVDGAVFDASGVPQLVLNVPAMFIFSATSTFRAPSVKPPLPPILVVDDSLTTRMLEQSILESAGYGVELATSAEQALEMAATKTYSLFLVDVEMPGMDGFGFVETTRTDERFKHVPAILVSSRSAPADLARGRAVGARAYIVKGHFDQRDLLRHIKAILGE